MAAFGLLLAVLAVYIGATLPPRAVALTTSIPLTVRFGGYHIHTDRSDGAWSIDDVAAAASRAGLHFIIVTDHGDATRTPDPPAYRHGVLVMDAVEISTDEGHVVALDLWKSAPYPLGGHARDVIDDIHRLGGWAVVAHPDSPKPELRWTAWDAPYDGIEWINADSEWRDEPKLRLAASALRAMVRGPETIVSLFSRPEVTISRWTEDLKKRPVIALGAMDAHGALPFANAMLRTVWQGVRLDSALTGDASDDAHRVIEAMRRGRTFTIIPAIAGPAMLEFSATQAGMTAGPGDRLDSGGAPATFHVSVPGVPEAHIEFLLNGRPALPIEGVPGRGAYHLEITWSHRDLTKPFAVVGPIVLGLPWLFSNAIYSGPPTNEPAVAEHPEHSLVRDALPLDRGWTIEHAAGSSGEVANDGESLRFGFSLGTQARSNPYAALVTHFDGGRALQSVQFVAHADRPTRISVQLRVPDGSTDGLRWRRSIYLDQTDRSFTIRRNEFQPAGGNASGPPPAGSAIRSLLFVADTVNLSPGAHGTVRLSKLVVSSSPAR